MSSSTDDPPFLEARYDLIAESYGCSLLHPDLALCRWDMKQRAVRAAAKGRLHQAAGWALLFAAHAARARLTQRQP